jgi:hypothetical protein
MEDCWFDLVFEKLLHCIETGNAVDFLGMNKMIYANIVKFCSLCVCLCIYRKGMCQVCVCVCVCYNSFYIRS